MKPFKIVFYPNTAKPNRKTKRIPIYMRVSKGKSKLEVSPLTYSCFLGHS